MSLPAPRGDVSLRPGYHSAQVEVEVRLNTNESPYPPPKAWLEAWQAELATLAFHRYPDRAAIALRRALADFHGVRADQVFCANGSNEVLQSLCLAYGGAGRRALTFEPTYALHAHIARLTGTEVIEAGRHPDFSLDLAVADDAIGLHDPDLVFLCSPNNPTGGSEDRSSVARVLERATGLVVVDEAYGQFADWSALSLVDDERPLVVTRTFSKTWSMAALRLGYLIGPAPVVAMLDKVALPYHLDAAKQAAGRLAVQYAGDMEERVGAIIAERRRVSQALSGLPVEQWPSQANFILWRPKGHKGTDVWQGLVERSVLVRDTSTWPGLEGCLRVTIGTPEENDRFLQSLGEVLS